MAAAASFSASSWQHARITRDLDRYLATLPAAVQEVFRKKIAELNLTVNKYCFQADGRRTGGVRVVNGHCYRMEKVTYVMAPEKDGGPDRASPLYTEVSIETAEETSDMLAGFFERLRQLISRICNWIRSFFARYLARA